MALRCGRDERDEDREMRKEGRLDLNPWPPHSTNHSVAKQNATRDGANFLAFKI